MSISEEQIKAFSNATDAEAKEYNCVVTPGNLVGIQHTNHMTGDMIMAFLRKAMIKAMPNGLLVADPFLIGTRNDGWLFDKTRNRFLKKCLEFKPKAVAFPIHSKHWRTWCFAVAERATKKICFCDSWETWDHYSENRCTHWATPQLWAIVSEVFPDCDSWSYGNLPIYQQKDGDDGGFIMCLGIYALAVCSPGDLGIINAVNLQQLVTQEAVYDLRRCIREICAPYTYNVLSIEETSDAHRLLDEHDAERDDQLNRFQWHMLMAKERTTIAKKIMRIAKKLTSSSSSSCSSSSSSSCSGSA